MAQSPVYIVQPGDSISLISKRLYGDFSQVDAIVEMNKISNKDVIYPGQQLLVPNVPGVVDTDVEVISSSSSRSSFKVWIGKAFPWIIVIGAAVLLGREAMKQQKKNKSKGMAGFDEAI